jgi:hypothetical protein
MKDSVNNEDITIKPTNDEPIIFSGKIDPAEIVLVTMVSQAYKNL